MRFREQLAPDSLHRVRSLHGPGWHRAHGALIFLRALCGEEESL